MSVQLYNLLFSSSRTQWNHYIYIDFLRYVFILMKTTTATKASTLNTKFGTFGLWDHNCAIWGLKEKGVTNLFCVYIYKEEGKDAGRTSQIRNLFLALGIHN